MRVTTESDRTMDDLVQEYVARRRRGERPTIEEYAAQRPEFAAFARELFRTLEALELLRARFRPR